MASQSHFKPADAHTARRKPKKTEPRTEQKDEKMPIHLLSPAQEHILSVGIESFVTTNCVDVCVTDNIRNSAVRFNSISREIVLEK